MLDVNHSLMARVEEALNDISKVTVAVQEDPRCRPDSQATPPRPHRAGFACLGSRMG